MLVTVLSLACAAVALLFGACASAPLETPESVPLATQSTVSAGCRQALGGGILGRNASSGLGAGGEPVRWPFGFSAIRIADRIVLLDESGRRVAVEGDVVRFGGGGGADGMFLVCPVEVQVIAGQP